MSLGDLGTSSGWRSRREDDLPELDDLRSASVGTYIEWAAFHGLTGSEAQPDASPARDDIANLIKFGTGPVPARTCGAH